MIDSCLSRKFACQFCETFRIDVDRCVCTLLCKITVSYRRYARPFVFKHIAISWYTTLSVSIAMSTLQRLSPHNALKVWHGSPTAWLRQLCQDRRVLQDRRGWAWVAWPPSRRRTLAMQNWQVILHRVVFSPCSLASPCFMYVAHGVGRPCFCTCGNIAHRFGLGLSVGNGFSRCCAIERLHNSYRNVKCWVIAVIRSLTINR